ncbi:hypothetical protein [uncultured Nocardioides sp.]|uniref:DUF7507 domain-containing protein n=1 Tax=uncultured Nocardioides sp. TaxID=198441 RepID=UPI0026203453|nr:hypothetical protein [uncultured Nocardioides sp.]
MATTRLLGCLRLALVLALTGLASAAGVVGVSAPAAADVYDPLTRVHTDQVVGDVVTVGNAVLVCPRDPDGAREDCLAASRRDNQLNNNRFAMRYADVDGDDSTVNSSSAEVRLPAGSRVSYARLSWAGNRGGQQCGVGDPGDYPEGSAEENAVRLRVGDAGGVDVAPQDYTRDTSSVGYYSADAVVTDAFAGVRAGDDGRDVRVTVGDVFAAEGRGCFGGWSLTLVHTAADPAGLGCDVRRREVFVYDGHVRQGVGDEPQTVTASGFRVAGGGEVRAGVTAYEGDNGQVGDRLRVNRTALADPATDKDDNFFASTAQGRVEPDYPNNFSVDAKRVEVPRGVIEPGDTEATLGVSTGSAGGADAFLLQGLTLSVPVPSLCLTKTVSPAVARAGDTVTWTLEVSNPSSVDVTGVEIDDPAVADCEQTVGDLAAGDSETVTCTSVVTEDLVNVASVTGAGPGGSTLTAVDRAAVDVVDPAVSLTKTAVEDSVVEGEEARWAITVRNAGDTALDEVVVDDPLVADCDRDLGRLDRGEEQTYRCAGTVTDDLTNTATVTASAPGGPALSASDSASVTVVPAPIAPAVEITKTAVEDSVTSGDRARWRITVANTGAGPLEEVTVDDPQVEACDRTLGTLAEGEERSHTCGRTIREDVENVATVTATGDGGAQVTDTDSATVRAEGPFTVTVTPEADRTVPEEEVDLTVELTNGGSESVSDLVVTADGATDCTRRRPIALPPGASRRYACTVEAGDDGDDLVVRTTALGEIGGFPTPARDTTRIEVLVPEVSVEVGRVAATDGTDGRTDVTVSNPGETPLRGVRLGVDGATLCQLPGGRLAAGDTATVTCGAASGDVTARVSAQPVLGDVATGPRVRDTATAAAPGTPGWEDDGTGDPAGTDPYDPVAPYDPEDPGSTAPAGLLPDTGAPGLMLPVLLLGSAMLGAGLWLLRRRRPTR